MCATAYIQVTIAHIFSNRTCSSGTIQIISPGALANIKRDNYLVETIEREEENRHSKRGKNLQPMKFHHGSAHRDGNPAAAVDLSEYFEH
jgi:hypothetical protein